MPLYAIGDRAPVVDPSAFVHPDAVLIGDVVVEAESSIWPSAVLRGDHGRIQVGPGSSVQDGTVVHCTPFADTVIGRRCTVGHNAHLEGCTIEDDCLVGSGSVVLHKAIVRSWALVGASALVPADMEVPSGSIALGVPATIKPDAAPRGLIEEAARHYVWNAHWYNAEMRRLD